MDGGARQPASDNNGSHQSGSCNIYHPLSPPASDPDEASRIGMSLTKGRRYALTHTHTHRIQALATRFIMIAMIHDDANGRLPPIGLTGAAPAPHLLAIARRPEHMNAAQDPRGAFSLTAAAAAPPALNQARSQRQVCLFARGGGALWLREGQAHLGASGQANCLGGRTHIRATASM